MNKYVKLMTLVLAIALFLSIQGVQAEEADYFTSDNLPTAATLNRVVDNPEVGDERSFIAVIDLKTGTYETDTVELKLGHTYAVNISVTNDAPETVLLDTRLYSNFPSEIATGGIGVLWAHVISYDPEVSLYENPVMAYHSVRLNTQRDIELRLTNDPILVYGKGEINATELMSDEILGGPGALLGNESCDGRLEGGETLQIVYYFTVLPSKKSSTSKHSNQRILV